MEQERLSPAWPLPVYPERFGFILAWPAVPWWSVLPGFEAGMMGPEAVLFIIPGLVIMVGRLEAENAAWNGALSSSGFFPGNRCSFCGEREKW